MSGTIGDICLSCSSSNRLSLGTLAIHRKRLEPSTATLRTSVIDPFTRIALNRDTTESAGVALLALAITSYMAMMFTGSTTFTTLAGAKLEVHRALPPILISAGTGAVLRVVAAFV